jgi:hemoglobin-like flavoprotein
MVTLAMLLVSFGLFAQNSKLDEIFNKFQGKEGVTSVILTSDLLKFASAIESKEPGMDVLKNISQVRIL